MFKIGKKDGRFWESAILNNETYLHYLNRLTELSLSMFEWKNLPDTVDARFLELCLFNFGQAVFFWDEALGYLGLQNAASGGFNVYRVPVKRRAYAANGYQKELTDKDSVIIYNNYMRTNTKRDVALYARRLYDIQRTIDVNANAQKTPIVIVCDETQKLTMENLYKEYNGNAPVIFGEKSLSTKGVNVLNTGAPYVCDKLFTLKTQIWNEALTHLGISNVNIQKRERLITDEVTRNNGGTIASRYGRLIVRQTACKQINRLFGLDIWCDYREDYSEIAELEHEKEEGLIE